jgi:hypothetical protein
MKPATLEDIKPCMSETVRKRVVRRIRKVLGPRPSLKQILKEFNQEERKRLESK